MSDSYTHSYTVKTWRDGPSPPGSPLPAGRIVRIEAEVILPTSATREQILEWAAYALGCGSIALDNPLIEYDMDVSDEPTLTDTGRTTDRLIRRDEVSRELVRMMRAKP